MFSPFAPLYVVDMPYTASIMIDAPFTFVLVVGTTMCAGHSGAMLVDTR
jgi:hypothetical protein